MALGVVDLVLLALSLLISAGIGIYHGIKGLKAGPEEYLMGGRSMNPIFLALSLTVGTVSAISIMGIAGEMYAYGTQLWMMDVGIALGMLTVAKGFLPIFYPLKMISLYQYIEERFCSPWLRKATVALNTALAYLFIGFLLFPPAIVLQLVTGLSTATNFCIMGIVSSLYSSFGGVKAVVFTDVFQSFIMIAGVLTIIIQGSLALGGLSKAWDIAYHKGRIEFFKLSFDPYERHSLWLVIVYGYFFSLSTYGVVQSQAQRTFSTSSIKQAQKVLYYGAIGMIVIRGLISLSGLVIFANFVDCDPLTKQPGPPKKDLMVVPIYVLQKMTAIPGLAGLFVAAIYAAVLSSVSTQVNSITALLWEDFLKNLPTFKNWSESKIGNLQKVLVFVSGIVGLLMAFFVSQLVSFLESLLKITGAMSGPMVGLFLVALYLPWVKAKGAAIGFLSSLIFSIVLVVQQLGYPRHPYLPLSTEGCPENSLVPSNNTSSNATSEKALHNSIYSISYCLNYCWGSLICVTVSLFITILTGSNDPSSVQQRVVDSRAWKLFVSLPRTHIKGVSLLKCCPKKLNQPSVVDVPAQSEDEELKNLKEVGCNKQSNVYV